MTSGAAKPRDLGRSSAGISGRIILADDNLSMRYSVARLLRSAYYQVFEAGTGAECMTLVRERRADMVLLDVNLPDIDGREVCRAIKADSTLRKTLVVHLTGTELSAESMVQGLAWGADAYLTHPIRHEVLLAQIDALLRIRRTEEALRAAENRFQQLVEQIPAIIYSAAVDDSGKILYMSPQVGAILGIPSKEFLSKPGLWSELLHPEDRDQVIHDMTQCRLNGSPFVGEYRMIRRDGKVLWFRDEAVVVRDTDDHPVCLQGVMVDITDRVEDEEQMRRQASLLNLAPDAILVRDLEDRIRFWNKGAETIYGWTAEEADAKPVTDLIFKDHEEFTNIKSTLLKRGEWTGELDLTRKDGQKITVISRWTLLRDRQGKPKSVLTISTDVTEKKALEQSVLQSQRLESIGRLASGIAHDLNNILAPVLLSVQMLDKEMPDPESKHLLKVIENCAGRGANIVRQILTFSQKMPGKRIRLIIPELIDEVARLARETFPPNITLRTEIADELRPVVGDATQIHQVLLNLCVNARDAMPEGGELVISARNVQLKTDDVRAFPEARPGKHVLISVEDTGMGIPRDILDKIFDPFFTTKGPGQGTGLGLSTVIGIVKSHAGILRVKTEDSRGTVFKVYLPAAPDAEPARERRASSRPPGGQGELVLVVDDESAIRELMKQTLAKNGYKVVTAEDGAAALDVLDKHLNDVRLVITDLYMPRMDGRALCRTLKTIAPDLRVIVTTGNANLKTPSGEAADLSELGVRKVLEKPFTLDKLLLSVHNALNNDT